ncbi:hypothetical protein HUW51_05230 [Adhaeribacter swui]|uniref:Uncharacterized protein n=1 Tax=Adhaeribacter swui TaxID=2086471 RepID=A0A7G7G4S6_9BACT|nr:hypothetical protein [Adhaeribacter swui]QNF32160.1 hypothetical protein HUW51_05230 [Adhaeribacter swui]
MIQGIAQKATNQEFRLYSMGSLEEFAQSVKKQRAENPAGEKGIVRQMAAKSVYVFDVYHAAPALSQCALPKPHLANWGIVPYIFCKITSYLGWAKNYPR